jgi:ketosteroid isomerase-like protein
MQELIEKTKSVLRYMTWVGEDPPRNSNDMQRMQQFIHTDFLLTYNGTPIICGIEQLGPHFIDAFKEIGHWRHDIHKFELLGKGNRYCVTHYTVVSEKKGSTPVMAICEFLDGLCVTKHEKVDFSLNKINAEAWVKIK